MKNENKWSPTCGGHRSDVMAVWTITELRRVSGNILRNSARIVNSCAKSYNQVSNCRNTRTALIMRFFARHGEFPRGLLAARGLFTRLELLDLRKKEEASAGSGGTAVHALAGGGNQSFLTASAACLGERRVPQPHIVTHPMQTLFPGQRKRCRKILNSSSGYAGTPRPAGSGPSRVIRQRHSLVPTVLARGLPFLAAAIIITHLFTVSYDAHADLIPVPDTLGIYCETQSPSSSNQLPINRLRDTVVGMEVQWPSRPSIRAAGDASSALMAMMNDPEPETRKQGLLGLTVADVPEITSILVYALDDPAPEVRNAALSKLAELDAALLTRELVYRLISNDEAARTAVERALPLLREYVETPMLSLFESPDADTGTRTAVARALGSMGSEAAIQALSSAALGPHVSLSKAAARALVEIGSPEALPALQELSRHSNAEVRASALVGLARIGGPVALSAIEEMATNPRESDPHTRRSAVYYIGIMGGPSSIATLIHAMNRYPEARDTAAMALTRITGINLGNSPQAWTSWYDKRKKAQEQAQKEEASRGFIGVIRPGGATSDTKPADNPETVSPPPE